MSEQKIHECLQGLRDELQQLKGENQQVRERVSGLIAEVEQQLLENEQENEQENQNPPLMESIKNTIELYKVEHPGVTGILNQIMMSLSNMGV